MYSKSTYPVPTAVMPGAGYTGMAPGINAGYTGVAPGAGGGFPGMTAPGAGYPGMTAPGAGYPGMTAPGAGYPGMFTGVGGVTGTMPAAGGAPGMMPGAGLPPQVSSGVPILPGGALLPGGMGQEESYVENILRMNLGKVATVYMTFENNCEWNAKIFKGVVEAAGRDHIIISDPATGKRYLLLTVNLDYITFDQPLVYNLPFGSGAMGGTGLTRPE